MTTHRFLWLFACTLAVALGLAVSLTWPTESALALFPVCAFLTGIAKLHYNLLTLEAAALSPLRSVMEGVARHALGGGLAMVGMLGLSALMGAWVLLLCMLLAVSSPGAMRFYRRRIAPAGVSVDHRPSSDDLPLAAHPLTAVECEARELTDKALCDVWRASFLQLREATSPTLQARIVAARHVYLDELARRNPAGLNAWLSSGTGVPEDASPILTSTSQSETSIDWDAAMFGQDDS